jgi:hypothetical protein
MRTAGFIGLGVGAAGVAIGVLGGILTIGAKSSADDSCPDKTQVVACNDANSRGKTWSGVSTAGFVIGGLGLAAGATMLVLAPKGQASMGALTARPVAGGAQLGWIGRF